MRSKNIFVSVVATAALSVGMIGAVPAPAEAAKAVNNKSKFSGTLKQGVKSLKVANPSNAKYTRTDYKHWIDADRNKLDTRHEVLRAESKVKVKIKNNKVVAGKWVSYYDKVKTTNPSTFDIDHMVPLGEANKSGAAKWTASTKKRFANDLGDPRSLVAVSATSNRSKGDRDPSSYLPKKKKCRYVTEWVAVKIRWSLSVDKKEKKAINKVIKGCKNGKKKIKVKKAKVYFDNTNTENPTTGNSDGLKVTKILYNPAGTDTLNGEYVIFKNTTTATIQLNGWTISDESGTTYTFGEFKLAAGAIVKLYSGTGNNSSNAVYWNRGVAVWNNNGDAFTLKNPSGTTKQTGSYVGEGDGSYATF